MADKTGYIGRSPSDSTTVIARQSFSVGITTDSFSFNSGYTPGYVDVYINGVKLIDVSDFSATDGSNITLLTAANNGDVVEVVAYKAFNIGSISDTPGNFNVGNVLTAQSGSVTGNFTVGGVLTYEDVNNVDSIGVVTARTGVDVLAGGVDITGGGLKVVGVTSLTGNTVVSNNADVTISSGSSVTTAEHFYFNDTKKANFGNDSDLQIYHNDTSAFIDNNKGALYIRNNVDNDDNSNIIIEAKSGESAAVFQDDEGVQLYYDGSEKISTTGSGVDVTGITTSDGFYATGTGVGTALFVDGNARVTGLRIDSTVGVGTALFVEGDARVTGILTVGTASVTLNGTTGEITGASLTNATVAGISTSTSDTAVDVFVYDTSKDSDGGAWRKRTQNTSWYNEALNTSIRGSRREFPAVAVIVTEATKVTIYDGDDPDLPMWMVFTWVGTSPLSALGYDNRAKSATKMINGQLVTCGDPDGVHVARFIHDDVIRTTASVKTRTTDAISKRTNAGEPNTVETESRFFLVSSACNDIAATVLPNTPIDEISGLPTPTIAVATDGGASVIKDDGNVIQLYTNDIYDKYTSIDFGDNGRVYYSPENTSVYYSTSIPPVNLNQTAYNSDNAMRVMFPSMDHGGFTYTNSTFPVRTLGLNGAIGTKIVGNKASASRDTSYEPYTHTNRQGLTLIDEGISNPTSSVAYISSSYNTGWMHGNIKGAFLSDTTAESLTANTNLASSATKIGSDRLSSETYTNGATSWQQVDNSGSDNGYLRIRFGGLTSGQSYQISMTVDANPALDGGYEHKLERSPGTTVYFNNWNGTGAATLTGNFTAGATTNDLFFYTNAATVNVTNFNIRQVDDEDRSYSNKGLGVYGTVTKSAVATGAELVGYSFSNNNSNYLEQPYNSDLDFGTDAFSISAWLKIDSDTTCIAIDKSTQTASQTNRTVLYYTDSSNSFTFYDSVGTVNSSAVQLNQWYHVVAVKEGNGGGKIYINGKLDGTSSSFTGNNSNTAHKLVIGNGWDYGYAWRGSIALVRISTSVPSPEQIKKFYDDEKLLFHENAKATYYGSSDPITALGYDEKNDTLHVGTSAGRSDFQGLSRINNTTTAVTTAISASDELIAEQ